MRRIRTAANSLTIQKSRSVRMTTFRSEGENNGFDGSKESNRTSDAGRISGSFLHRDSNHHAGTPQRSTVVLPAGADGRESAAFACDCRFI